jgi:hypothetical protein
MERKTYEIDGKRYTQGPIVPGQLKQVYGLIEGLSGLEVATADAAGITAIIGDHLSGFLAIILVPEGTKIKDKDVQALTAEFEESLPLAVALEAVEDFFTFNPISSMAERIKGLLPKIMPPAAAPKEPETA